MRIIDFIKRGGRAVYLYFKGFEKNHWKIALQITCIFALIGGITAPTVIYEALSYRLIASPLSLLFTVWLYASPFCAGEVNFKTVVLIPAAFLGGLIAFAIQWSMYAANDRNWNDNSVTKAAVLVCMATPIVAFFNGLRWKYEATNVFFFYTNIFIALSINLGSYYAPYIEDLHQWYILLNAVIGTGACVICSNFLFPITAGSLYRQHVSDSLESLSEAIGLAENMLMGPIDPKSGRLACADGCINPVTGHDQGMAKDVNEIADKLLNARRSLSSTRSLHIPVFLEIDVYQKPRRFPRHQFFESKLLIGNTIATLSTALQPIESGKLNFLLIQHPEIKPKLEKLTGSMQETFRELAGAVKKEVEWKIVDCALAEMDISWVEFLEEVVVQVPTCPHKKSISALRTISELYYLVGTRLRDVYKSLATAVSGSDSDAVEISRRRLKCTPGWTRPSEALINHHWNVNYESEKIQQEIETDDKIKFGDIGKGMKKNSALRRLMFKKLYGHKSNKVLRTRYAYGMPLWLVFGIQYGVPVAISLILASIPVVAEKAFIDRPFDVIITVIVVWVPNIGTTTTRGVQRVFGTVLTAAVSYVIIGFAYLASDSSWGTNPAKFIIGWSLASVYAGFCVLNMQRYSSYEYFWTVANFTLATTTLPVFRATDSPWKRLGQRSANMITGGLIIWIAAIFIFPISTRWMTQVNFASGIKYLARLFGDFRNELTSKEEASNKDEYLKLSGSKSSSNSRAMVKLQQDPEAFYNFMQSESFNLKYKIQKCIDDILDYVEELENEYLPFRRPPKIPEGVVMPATYALQELFDIINVMFALKKDIEPIFKWPIPQKDRIFLNDFIQSVVEALIALDEIILKPRQANTLTLLTKLGAVEDILKKHVTYSIQGLVSTSLHGSEMDTDGNVSEGSVVTEGTQTESFEDPSINGSKTGPDEPGDDEHFASKAIHDYRCTQANLGLLIYLEICCNEQLRTLVRSVCNAVLISNPEAAKDITQVNEGRRAVNFKDGKDNLLAQILEATAESEPLQKSIDYV